MDSISMQEIKMMFESQVTHDYEKLKQSKQNLNIVNGILDRCAYTVDRCMRLKRDADLDFGIFNAEEEKEESEHQAMIKKYIKDETTSTFHSEKPTTTTTKNA